MWDYCQASARLFFDAAPIDPTARRISEALNAAPEGLTKAQISALFHRHVSRERIDLALQQLSSLGAVTRHIEAGRGRPSTLWAAAEDTKAAGAPPISCRPWGRAGELHAAFFTESRTRRPGWSHVQEIRVGA